MLCTGAEAGLGGAVETTCDVLAAAELEIAAALSLPLGTKYRYVTQQQHSNTDCKLLLVLVQAVYIGRSSVYVCIVFSQWK